MTDIGVQWYLNNMRGPKLPMKNMRLIHKQQQEDNKLKDELKGESDHWKYLKFQIHLEIEIFCAT